MPPHIAIIRLVGLLGYAYCANAVAAPLHIDLVSALPRYDSTACDGPNIGSIVYSYYSIGLHHVLAHDIIACNDGRGFNGHVIYNSLVLRSSSEVGRLYINVV